MLNPVQDEWKDHFKKAHHQNQEKLIAELKAEYGEHDFATKLENFKALGVKPISVLAYHNRLLNQSRRAFVSGQYYPALTAICALGERILNHLILKLRDSYKSHHLYKTVCHKDSFDNWATVINALTEWGVLTAKAADGFQLLRKKRNEVLHFNSAIEANDRQLAIDAIMNFQEIVSHQFSAFGSLPWLLPSLGECFIKKEFEASPFIKEVYLPNCAHLGYKHRLKRVLPFAFEFQDADDYPDQNVSDEEFIRLRREFREGSQGMGN